MTAAAHPALDALAERLGERVVLPGDERWDRARRPWNLAVEQRPLAVVTPGDVSELQDVLAAARADGVQLAVQPSGHGASGSLDGAVLVRTSAFDALEIDTDARVARIGAGVQWSRVLTALDGTGLTAMSGSSPIVNATAFTLGGGHSWFARAFGLASSSLRAVELLTADGRHRWLRDADEPELMWALRGAGGAFGIVTAIEVDLYPAPMLTGGRIVFPGSDAAAVFHALVDVGGIAPDTLALHASVVRVADIPEAPPEARGTAMVSAEFVELGASDEVAALLDRVRAAGTVIADTTGSIGVGRLDAVADEPTDPAAELGWSVFARLDDPAIDRLFAAWESPEARPVMALSMRVLGGALAAEPARPAIAGAVHEPHLLWGNAPAEPGAEQRVDLAYRALHGALGTAASDRTFCTFLRPGQGYSAAYARTGVARAAAVKATVDPEDRFRGNRDFV